MQRADILDVAAQVRQQHVLYRRVHLRRSLTFWWYRILLIALGGCVAAILGLFVVGYPKAVIGGMIALVLFFLAIRRLEFGLVLLGVLTTPFVPSALSVRSLQIYPVEILLAVLFVVILVQAVFHVRKFVRPSFWTIWPQLGLITLAIFSSIMIHATWLPQVPRKVNGGPIIYSEMLGVLMYFIPLITITVTVACLTRKDQWIQKLLTTLLVVATIAAAIVCVEFKRLGGDVYFFRYQEPHILYMQLSSLAQLVSLGAIIAYARCLLTDRWRPRLVYAAIFLVNLAALVFTNESARWLEAAAALIVMTVVFSRRLTLLFCALSIPMIPLGLKVYARLQQVKARDVTRFSVWADYLRVWSKRPILGVGPGNAWTYDQFFTRLPLHLQNFQYTGLGVAHNGTLQLLAEVGPLGVFFLYAFIVVVIIAASRLYRRSRTPARRPDRVLALLCLGLICGAVPADFVSGIFFMPPSQIGSFNVLPDVLAGWIVFGCLFYKDQLWRQARTARATETVRALDLPVLRIAQTAPLQVARATETVRALDLPVLRIAQTAPVEAARGAEIVQALAVRVRRITQVALVQVARRAEIVQALAVRVRRITYTTYTALVQVARASVASVQETIQRLGHPRQAHRLPWRPIAVVAVVLIALALLYAGMSAALGSHSQPAAPVRTAAPIAPTAPTRASTPLPVGAAVALTFTCASAVDYGSGRICIHTQPGAALAVTVTYCSGFSHADPSSSLQGTVYADNSGDYVWRWTPQTTCHGTALAYVTAKWHGQVGYYSYTFTVQ